MLTISTGRPARMLLPWSFWPGSIMSFRCLLCRVKALHNSNPGNISSMSSISIIHNNPGRTLTGNTSPGNISNSSSINSGGTTGTIIKISGCSTSSNSSGMQPASEPVSAMPPSNSTHHHLAQTFLSTHHQPCKLQTVHHVQHL